MKSYFKNFLQFSLKESIHWEIDKLDHDYVKGVNHEVFNMLKEKNFNGWEVEEWQFQHIGSFLFLNDQNGIQIYITPFWEGTNSIAVGVGYAGYIEDNEHIERGLFSLMKMDESHDAKMVYDMILSQLTSMSDEQKLITKIINLIGSPIEAIECAIEENDPVMVIMIIEHLKNVQINDLPQPQQVRQMFGDDLAMANTLKKNLSQWEEAFDRMWGQEESNKFLSNVKKILRGKSMFGV